MTFNVMSLCSRERGTFVEGTVYQRGSRAPTAMTHINSNREEGKNELYKGCPMVERHVAPSAQYLANLRQLYSQ